MYVIGTSIGQVIKFESLVELQEAIETLQGMVDWATSKWEEDPDYPVKLAYIRKPDYLVDEDREWLDWFTDNLDNATKS